MGLSCAIRLNGAGSHGTGRIVWLASYPKSGNTWLRSLLTAYQLEPGATLDINRLQGTGAAWRSALDDLLGLCTGELAANELQCLLPHAYRAWSLRSGTPEFLKTHDVYGLTPRGEPVFPAAATRCVVHLVRDPRDVAVSALHHWGLDLDATIARINNPRQWVGTEPDSSPLVGQHLSDWSSHAAAWLGCPLHRLTLRYEDMLADPAAHLRDVLRFMGEAPDEARLAQAVAICSIDRLQAQERASGFGERRHTSTAPFFRSGKSAGWRSVLSGAQHDRIVDMHASMMQTLGYAP